MNIASIQIPGAAPSPFDLAPPGTGQSFAQQFGATLLPGPNITVEAALPGAAAPASPLPLAMAPVASAADPAVPTALSAPLASALELAAMSAPASRGRSSPEIGVVETPTAAMPDGPQGEERPAAESRPSGIAATDAIKPSCIDLLSCAPLETAAAPAAGGAGADPASLIDARGTDAPDIRSPAEQERGTALDYLPDATPSSAPLGAEVPLTSSAAPTHLQSTAHPVTPLPVHHAPPAATTDAPPVAATATAIVDGGAGPAGTGLADRAPVEAAGAARTIALQPQVEGLPSPHPGSGSAAPLGAPAAPVFAARLAEAYPAAPVAPQAMPVVEARSGRIGHDMGIEIARRLLAGKEELTVRLNPADLGRVEVRMGFDDAGNIRAVVAAESPVALELLRRDAGELARALGDAGIRSDAQSFRFDARGGDFGQSGQRSPDPRRHHDRDASMPFEAENESPIYRPLRTSGRIDLMA